MTFTFDSGALIAIEGRKLRAVRLLTMGLVFVPSPCIAEWWRGRTDRRDDIVSAIRIDWLTERTLKLAGEALAAVTGRLTIDAIVMASAASRRDSVVVTSDPDDMLRLQTFFPGVRVLAV